MSKLKAVIFDVDGVIIFSQTANVGFFQAILEKAGYPKPSREKILECFHMTFKQTIEHLIGSEDKNELERLWAMVNDRNLYPLHLLEFPKNIEKILSDLHEKYRLAIVTGRVKSGVDDVFKIRKIGKFFDVVVTSEEYLNPKPHPEPMLLAIQRLKIQPEEAVYIGDSHTDIESAKTAGLFSIHLSLIKHDDASLGITDFSEIPKAVALIDKQ